MDLKKAPDHPSVLLDQRAERMTRSISATQAERSATFRAAEVLREHEWDKDITFAALDNDTLRWVQEAWEARHLTDLAEAVRDLLDLDD